MLFGLSGSRSHVLMTADAVGGIWTYAVDLGATLRARGHEVTLVVLGPAASSAQARHAHEKRLALVELGHAPDWLARNAEGVLAAGAALASLARQIGATLVHLNHPALAACRSFDEPVVALCHSCVATWWDAVREGALPEDFRWRTDLVGDGLKRADAIVAPTGAFAEATHRVYGLDDTPLVVWNGRSAAPASARKPDGGVFTAGRLWDEGKNVAALDRVAPRLPVLVEAAGPLQGPNGSAITFSNLRALGRLDDTAIRAKFEARPVYAAPALYEPFGLAVLEAAQAGCPLVLADIPTFRELWDGAALFADPRSDEALATEISRVLASPALRAELGAAAAERAQRYTDEASADGMEAVYEALTATSRSATAHVTAA